MTALASWLSAKQAQGEWLLRIDDLDRPRCVAGAEARIFQQLEAHGLLWDGVPTRQTAHEDEYRAALARLQAEGWLYPCTCTRVQLAISSLPGPDGPIYAGTCRQLSKASGKPQALRLRVPDGSLSWFDGVQGLLQRQVPLAAADFVVLRADGQIGYHLACALDELRMGITEVVRGADLLGATVCQLQLLQALRLTAPRYAHVPVLLAGDGRKLSKQNGAAALATDAAAVARQLMFCLQTLGLAPPATLTTASAQTILAWALPHWQLSRLAAPTLP